MRTNVESNIYIYISFYKLLGTQGIVSRNKKLLVSTSNKGIASKSKDRITDQDVAVTLPCSSAASEKNINCIGPAR